MITVSIFSGKPFQPDDPKLIQSIHYNTASLLVTFNLRKNTHCKTGALQKLERNYISFYCRCFSLNSALFVYHSIEWDVISPQIWASRYLRHLLQAPILTCMITTDNAPFNQVIMSESGPFFLSQADFQANTVTWNKPKSSERDIPSFSVAIAVEISAEASDWSTCFHT